MCRPSSVFSHIVPRSSGEQAEWREKNRQEKTFPAPGITISPPGDSPGNTARRRAGALGESPPKSRPSDPKEVFECMSFLRQGRETARRLKAPPKAVNVRHLVIMPLFLRKNPRAEEKRQMRTRRPGSAGTRARPLPWDRPFTTSNPPFRVGRVFPYSSEREDRMLPLRNI